MRINSSLYTISELLEAFERKDIIINNDYQRAPGIWPDYARSYFIETILDGFPFPKLYFYQTFNDLTKKPNREVIDGQQRLTTIYEFSKSNLRLTSASKKYRGETFLSLSEEKQKEFLMYSIQVDVILAADRKTILEMFRRMNAFTMPLNNSEKRHAEFQGKFKFFVIDLSDNYSILLEDWGVFNQKQILRMLDAEFYAEIALLLESGITHRSDANTRALYKKHEDIFAKHDEYFARISEAFDTVKALAPDLKGSMMFKPYVLHSLLSALLHLKYGLPNGIPDCDIQPKGCFYRDRGRAIEGLLRLSRAHENQELDGPYFEYVKACLDTTTKIKQRSVRTKFICEALLSE